MTKPVKVDPNSRHRICVRPDGERTFEVLIVGSSGGYSEGGELAFSKACTLARRICRTKKHAAYRAPLEVER